MSTPEYPYPTSPPTSPPSGEPGREVGGSPGPNQPTVPVAPTMTAPPVTYAGQVRQDPAAAPTRPAGDPTAVLGRRAAAHIIDALVMTALFVVLVVVAGDKFDVTGIGGRSYDVNWRLGDQLVGIRFGDTAYIATDSAFWAVTLGTLVVWLFFRIVLEGATGATPGKAIAGVRTVRTDGQAAGLGPAFIRTVLWIVDGFPYFLPIVGIVVVLSGPRRQRVGDRVANTYVVGLAYVGFPLQLPGATIPTVPAAAASAAVAGPPVMTAATPPTAPASAPADDPTKPRWDPARNAYIQWEPHRRVWLQWSEAERQWKVLG